MNYLYLEIQMGSNTITQESVVEIEEWKKLKSHFLKFRLYMGSYNFAKYNLQGLCSAKHYEILVLENVHPCKQFLVKTLILFLLVLLQVILNIG